MNIKLFYNVPWYVHHDRLEAKDNLKAAGVGGAPKGHGPS